jgi:hypothetical protein
MTRQKSQTQPSTLRDARHRLRMARAYVDAAELVLVDDRLEFSTVAAGLAVLAGIAAADAICSRGRKMIHRGDDHRAAADLLASTSADGKHHKRELVRLLDLKDESHYGLIDVSASRAKSAVKTARRLTDQAETFLQR